MSKLIELNNLNSDSFMDLLRNNDILIYENIQGSKVFFNFNDGELTLRQRSINNRPINKVDMALQKFYSKAFEYLDNIDPRAKKLCPENWFFCCQYFPDEKPAHIKYDKIPKNHLILTSIVKNGEFFFDINEINEYANLFGIEPQPVLFFGKLSDKQLSLINKFLHTSKEDLEYVFGESESFSSFFYKILNPNKKNSILMEEGNYQSYLDKLVIKVDNGDEASLEILNPLYSKTENKETNHLETYSIILTDFLEFLQKIDFSDIHMKGKFGDEIYIDMICDLFNRYIEDGGWRIRNFSFDVPSFLQDDKFRMNKDMIPNRETKKIVDSSEKMEYIFKTILQSFRKKKERAFGVLNVNTLKIFNDTVEAIDKAIDKTLRIDREEELKKHNLLDFGSFYDLQYPKGDGEGNIYPELHKDINTSTQPGNKKKKAVNKTGK